MTYKSAFCAGLIAFGVVGTTSAQAQFFDGPRYYPAPMYEAGVSPGEVLMIVRASGLRPLTQPALRGSRYVLLASDNMGGQLRVFVSARNGRIVHASPAHDSRFAYEPVRPRGMIPVPGPNATPGQELKDPPPVIYGSRTPAPGARNPNQPPGAATTPDERVANAPAEAIAPPRRPARTPLPRPRPDATAKAAPAATVDTPATAAPQAAAPAQTPAELAPTAPAASPVAPQNAPRAAPTELVPVAPLE